MVPWLLKYPHNALLDVADSPVWGALQNPYQKLEMRGELALNNQNLTKTCNIQLAIDNSGRRDVGERMHRGGARGGCLPMFE